MKTKVIQDDITDEISKMFDYEFDGETEFNAPELDIPNSYGIGLIVGPSGSGKSTILKRIGKEERIEWDSKKCIASCFNSADEAKDRLSGVGFNSIPSWLRPYHVLSTGEKFRAEMAMRLKSHAVIDEFTSVVDRKVAASCSNSVNRFIKSNDLKNVTFATCHYDVIEWLRPDWVFDTKTGILSRGSLRRPTIKIELSPCWGEEWRVFSDHHYLSGDINKAAHTWVAKWGKETVGFTAILAFPNGSFKNAWREHRTVVLPEFQGMGIGVRISDAIGELMLAQERRYFSKTVHPNMGKYRDKSKLWRATTKNHMVRHDYNNDRITKESMYKHKHANRWAYSHEYRGSEDD